MNQEKFKKNKAIFFDRDGVLNFDKGYIHKIKDFKWIDGAKKTIKYFNELNYKVIVITNQSGISRGFYTEKDLKKLHEWMNKELIKINAKIDDFFYNTEMPNSIKSKNSRRKPSPAMINDAVKKYNIIKKDSFLVGDKLTDMEAAQNAKIKGFLFKGGNLYNYMQSILKT